MSIQKESIQVIAQTLGINKLKEEIAQALASDVEYRIREIIQDAAKFMKHSKRTNLTTQDVNNALAQKNVEPLYGFSCGAIIPTLTGKKSSTKKHRFRRAQNTTDLYFLEDPELDIKECLRAPLPKLPIGPTITSHWLAIQGVQPKIPQNPAPPTDKDVGEQSKASLVTTGVTAPIPGDVTMTNGVEVKPLVKHVLSAELQMYYEKLTEAIKGDKPLLRRACIDSLALDPGLHQLVPYFTQFVAEEVTNNMRNLPLLYHLMQMTRALLVNPTLHIELYLHQLMPSILTCLVAKRLCENPNEDHWGLRDLCAGMIGHICKKYGSTYHTLQPRLTKALLHAFLDAKKPRTTHYGAIVGITALGPHVAQLLFLEPSKNSNLRAYCRLLLPDLESNDVTIRYEAQKCYGALLDAVNGYFVRLAPFFKQKSQVDLNINGKQIEEEEEVEMPRVVLEEPLSGQRKATEELTRALRERMNALVLPDDIAERYEELYELFGESLLPFIFYDIAPQTIKKKQGSCMLADVFL
jgi:transcription initiation factor TFIID subunit 6